MVASRRNNGRELSRSAARVPCPAPAARKLRAGGCGKVYPPNVEDGAACSDPSSDRLAGALADALADRADPKAAVELLKAVHNDSARLDTRLDWLLPHLRSLIGGYQLRLGDKDKATTNLRTAVERMDQSYLKPPVPVLAAARARLAQIDEAKNAAKGQPPPSGR